jgi:hypothetical protein
MQNTFHCAVRFLPAILQYTLAATAAAERRTLEVIPTGIQIFSAG